MPITRRSFIQNASLLAVVLPLVERCPPAAEKAAPISHLPTPASCSHDSPSAIDDLHKRDPRGRSQRKMFHLDTKNRDRNGRALFVSPDELRWNFTGTALPAPDASSLWSDCRATHRGPA